MLVSRKQGDPRWGKEKIGKTAYTIAQVGCLITAISDAAAWWGLPDLTPNVMAKKLSFTNEARLYWQSVSNVGLKFIYRYYTCDRKIIDETLKHKTKCVFLEFKYGYDRHWVWCIGKDWTGKYKIADPLRGDFATEARYGAPTGFAIIDRKA